MATRQKLGVDVFNAAVDRMIKVYESGARVVVSFSAGKDSTCVLEVCLLAARITGRLPVDVVLRDEEINLPGTYEYAERVATRPEIRFHWLVANQPIINVFNRKDPYFWVFDPALPPDEWVRQPPGWATYIPEKNIDSMVTPARFPPDPGKELVAVMGLRVSESKARLLGLFSSGGYMTGANRHGVRYARPIYDWDDGAVWKAIHENRWDYNHAYDMLLRLGRPRRLLRIAPPTMSHHGIDELALAAQAWPRWFDKVAARLQGVRTAAMFGKRAVTPQRRLGETWEACFRRECITEAPAQWLAERCALGAEMMVKQHARHATTPFPDIEPCLECKVREPKASSWKKLAFGMYNGDPFSLYMARLPYVEPEFFRAGAGTWGGKPAF